MNWRLLLVTPLLLCSIALAVKPGHWTQTTQDDFKAGDLENVVATNLGDLKLSRAVKQLTEQDPKVSATFCIAQAKDGTLYVGTGPEGLLLKILDGKVTTVAQLGEHVNIFSLLIDSKGRLLIGTGGEKGEIYRLDLPDGKPQRLFASSDVQYVWSMLQTVDGMIYAATGPNGQLYSIDESGKSTVLFDGDENNLLCLASDGKDLIYAGTDPNGLVLEINRKTGAMRVLYDAAESEVSALVRDDKGNLFAATADAQAASAENASGGAADESSGRLEATPGQLPIPAPGRSEPKPPDLPNPSPGEPLPIPKSITTHPAHLRILSGGAAASRPAVDTDAGGTAASSTDEAPNPAAGNGNAVYQIDSDGFVTEVFRQSLSIYSLLLSGDSLLMGTGDGGELYQVNTKSGEISILATTDAHAILSLLPIADGKIAMGLANEGGVAELGSGYASEGTFTSKVFDATQIARFGKMQLDGWLPKGTELTVSTRSGNVEDALSPGWSAWSEPQPAMQYFQIPSAAGRFLQYKLHFAGTANDTPIVQQINVAYLVPNQAPTVKSIKIGGDELTDNAGKVNISWEATDPNSDELTYKLFMRNDPNGPWILLKEKLTDASFDWDTKTVADGRYWIKVEASDAAANPVGQGKTASRVSDSYIVDNTAPIIGDAKAVANGTTADVSLNVYDRTSTVAGLAYSVDSSEEWQNVSPSDTIADSPEEAYHFTVEHLSAGPHQITVRAVDSKDNRALASFTVTVAKSGS